MLGNKSELINLQKQNTIYEKDQKVLKSRLTCLNYDYESQLSKKNLQLQHKLENLTKLNQKLSKSPSPRSLSPVLTTIEPLFREIINQKSQIKSIEKAVNETQAKNRLYLEKISVLEKQYEKLLKKSSNRSNNNTLTREFEELNKKFRVFEKSFKSSVVKLEKSIKEKEVELKCLKDEETRLFSKIIKQDQQRRLLNASQNEHVMMVKSGFSSPYPDIHQPGVEFLNRPSIKALYST